MKVHQFHFAKPCPRRAVMSLQNRHFYICQTTVRINIRTPARTTSGKGARPLCGSRSDMEIRGLVLHPVRVHHFVPVSIGHFCCAPFNEMRLSCGAIYTFSRKVSTAEDVTRGKVGAYRGQSFVVIEDHRRSRPRSSLLLGGCRRLARGDALGGDACRDTGMAGLS